MNIFSEDPMEECKKKTNASVPDEYSIDPFRHYIGQKWMAIHAIIQSGHFSDDHVHLVRKHLKDLSYNLKLFEIIEPDILSQSAWQGKEAFYFDTLPDELGNSQDKCTALALLKPYWLLALNKYNREHLQRIKNSWINDKVNIKKMLVKKLKMGMVSGKTGTPIAEARVRFWLLPD